MEISARREGERLVLSLAGRMDGTGAQQAAEAIRQHLNDHDTAIIFDLGGVDYLSSAGLRVLQDSIRTMKARKGRVAVCRLRDFTGKILKTGGFLQILSVYPSVEDALNETGTEQSTPPGEIRIAGNGWSLSAVSISDSPCTLSVTGSLRAVHEGRITTADIQETGGCTQGFCIGIGAMGTDSGSAAPLAGEMISIGGTVYWIPTDGNLTPDYFTAKDTGSSGMKVFSLFNAAFPGPFTHLVRISSDKPEGMTLADIYGALFRFLKEQKTDFRGICAIAMKATIGNLSSSDLKTSLLAACTDPAARKPVAMPGGKTVTELPFDRSIPDRVSVINVNAGHTGDILIGVGYGIDTGMAEESFQKEEIAALWYSDVQRSGSRVFLYNKGAVFKNLKWDNAAGFEEQAGAATDAGEFVSMHNLLGSTTLKSALIGISPVTAIKKGP